MNYNILFLTLSAFSSTGGIQKVCRSMSHTLNRISSENPKISFKMYALNDENTTHTNYLKKNEFKGYEGNKILFALNSAAEGIKSNAVIISHINLLSLAVLIKSFNKSSRIIMMAHGIEVWRGLAPWKKAFIKKHVTIWAVSNFTAGQLKSVHQIDQAQIITLHNCVDPFFKIPSEFSKPIKLLNRYKLLHDQPVLLTIARLTKFDKAKGYDQTLEIIPDLLVEFPDLRYILCGKYDKKEKNRLEKLIRKRRLENTVQLVNFIPEEELEDHYRLADVFILISRKEGFGLVYIEATACGCRIVSGNTDGSIDAMQNGKLGIMVDPTNTDHIKEAVVTQLKNLLTIRKPMIFKEFASIFSATTYILNV